jgi:hypothetical protein
MVQATRFAILLGSILVIIFLTYWSNTLTKSTSTTMSHMKLKIPSPEENQEITKSFMRDLRSFSYKNEIGIQCPVICAVCDGIPKCANWFKWIDIPEMKQMCAQYGMTHNDMKEYYPKALIEQYDTGHVGLHECLLSPHSQIMNDKIMVCKSCLADLQKNKNEAKKRNLPKESIANGYLIGEAPEVLTRLNPVELAIVSRVRIYSQCWTFFAGCHKHIKGWHTFFKNQHESTTAHLNLLGTSSIRDNILVVLAGPFTVQQNDIVRDAIKVDVKHVQEAIAYLIEYNIEYENDRVPTEDEIPVPIIMDENQNGKWNMLDAYKVHGSYIKIDNITNSIFYYYSACGIYKICYNHYYMTQC